MNHPRPRLALLFAAATASAAALPAPPVTTLTKPSAEFPQGYSDLTSLRELPDGRVMAIEGCERVIKLLNLSSGLEAQVGRTGSGPGEYRFPGRLLMLPGDSTAIYDGGNRRFLVIGGASSILCRPKPKAPDPGS